MVVCIVGSMRSGTSMVANLLRLSGMYLGPEADLLSPGPDNPEGFWENIHFVTLNNAILRAFGGTWDAPPRLPAGWERDERLAPMRIQAAHLLESFADRAFWGWKDPRTSLTLPFWRQFLPTMQVVLCVRNPIEVARSLHYRQWFPHRLSVNLWYHYNRSVLDAVPRGHLIVTNYAAYFEEPCDELGRLLRFLAVSPVDGAIADSYPAIHTGLRHHRLTDAHLAAAKLPPAVIELNDALSRMAGDADAPQATPTPGPNDAPFAPAFGSPLARAWRRALWPVSVGWHRWRAAIARRRWPLVASVRDRPDCAQRRAGWTTEEQGSSSECARHGHMAIASYGRATAQVAPADEHVRVRRSGSAGG